MEKIEKITQRIEAAVASETDSIISEAREKAIAIEKEYQEKAERMASENRLLAEKAADEKKDRLISVAQMQARQIILGAKQEVVEKAFDMALEKLKQENLSDCETQMRLRKPEISVELAKLLFPKA